MVCKVQEVGFQEWTWGLEYHLGPLLQLWILRSIGEMFFGFVKGRAAYVGDLRLKKLHHGRLRSLVIPGDMYGHFVE